MRYSAQVLFQELKERGYSGGTLQPDPWTHRETSLPLGSLRITPESQVRSHVFKRRSLLANSESLKVI